MVQHIISFWLFPFFFFPPLFLSLLDSLLNLLDMLSSLCVRNARFELALNAINFLLVRHFCLILNEPFAHNKEAIKSHSRDTCGDIHRHSHLALL